MARGSDPFSIEELVEIMEVTEAALVLGVKSAQSALGRRAMRNSRGWTDP